jgi:hypothetical protein
MQTIINVLALSSFLVSATAVGSGVYIYTNKDALIKEVKEQVMDSILPGALTGGLSGDLVPNPTQLLPSPTETLTDTPQYTSSPTLPFSPF